MSGISLLHLREVTELFEPQFCHLENGAVLEVQGPSTTSRTTYLTRIFIDKRKF
jgi:hypothetical protein